MAIFVICVALANVPGKAVNRKVHFCDANGLVGFFLAVNRNLTRSPCFLSIFKMPLYKLVRLHEHAAGTAGGVVNPTLIRLDDFYDELDDACRRKKFASTRAIRKRKLTEEVFIN